MFESQSQMINNQASMHNNVGNRIVEPSNSVTPPKFKESSIDKAAIEILGNLENIYRRGSVTSNFMHQDH